MSGNWTPGPWWVDVHTNILGPGGGLVAFPGVAAGFPQKANAHLIAAAPDMYPIGALIASLPIGPNTPDDVPLYGLDGIYITHGDVRAARAAIAKAEGRS